MPATPLPASTRFFAPEVTKVYWLPSCANINSPTRAEITAGDDLSGEIAALSGWTVESGFINTPDLGSRFTSMIPGRTSAPSSSITFYASKDGEDVRGVLARNDAGFVMFCDGGDVPTQPADVFPATVASVGKVRQVDDGANQLTIAFAITAEPAEDVAIPAAT